MNLNENELKVLKILDEDPFVSQQYMADRLQLSRPAVANLISGLQDKGYILGKPYLLRRDEYVTCIGSANIDYTLSLNEKMIYGTSNPVTSSFSFGGVVRNIAENLARLDHKVSLMALVGEDNMADLLLDDSRKIMETFATDKVSQEKTGAYYSIIDKNGNMNVGFADMAINFKMDRSWILQHRKHLHLSNWLIADLNVQKTGIETLLEFSAQEQKQLILVGVSGPKMKNLPADLMGVHLLVCNLDESQAYFSTTNDNPAELCEMWLKTGLKNIVVTAGKNGSWFGDSNTIKRQEALYVKNEDILDVTGAGDAFSAGVIHGMIQGQDISECVKIGTVNASLTIKSPFSVNKNLSKKLIESEYIKL